MQQCINVYVERLFKKKNGFGLICFLQMEKVIEILENYQNFLQVKPAGSIQEFDAWLQRNPEEVQLDQPELNNQKLNIKFAYTLSKLSSFLGAWVKLSFRDIPLRSLGDFGILMSRRFMQNPHKLMLLNK